jgi:hypothetical protein
VNEIIRQEDKVSVENDGRACIANPTFVSLGLILRLSLEDVPGVKAALLGLPTTRIVYQRLSPGHLLVIEANQHTANGNYEVVQSKVGSDEACKN